MELKKSKEKIEFKAIKFGVSEHKRSNILDFYFAAAKSFKNLNNVNYDDNDQIYKELLKNKVYEKSKINKNIGREKTFFKNRFPLYENIENKIKITKLSEKILNFSEKKIFNGKSYLENSLIIFLIQSYPTRKIYENPFFYAINLAKNGNFSKEKFLQNIFEINKKKIYENLKEINRDELIKKYFKFKSGNPNPTKDKGLIEFHNKKNKLIKLIVDYSYKKNNEKEVIDYLYKFIKYYEILNNKKLISNLPKVFIKIFNFNKRKISIFINDFEKNNLNKYFNFMKENIDLIFLLENFYFLNKKNDYISLINKYLFNTDFFIVINNFVKINKIYKIYIENLEKNYNEILKISLKEDDIIDELKKLDFKNDVNEFFSIRKIINLNYNELFFDSFFDIFINQENNVNNFNKKLMKLSLKNNHINGILDPPTFFEFTVNLFFFILFYKDKISNESKYSDDYLTKEFEKCINTNLSTNLIPIRFASGNRSDAVFFKEKILIEPSLQMKNQIKHELNSIINHLKKYNFNYSIFIAPEIEEDFLIQTISYKYRDQIILPMSIKSLKKIKDSNFDIKLFLEIKKEFSDCEKFSEVSHIYNKYNFK